MITGRFQTVVRTLMTSSLTHEKVKLASFDKQVKMMKKVMAGREKGKRRWTFHEGMTKVETAKDISDPRGQRKPFQKRVVVLNKLFMKNVSDMLATETFAQNLTGYGLQITNVKMAQDFRAVNVYWLARSDENDQIVQSLLNSIAGPLRHELSQLRIMGEVPRIYFLRDRNFSKASEIDSILKQCDFGEDFMPTDPTLFEVKMPEVEMKLSDEIRKKIQMVESEHEEDLDSELDIPPMTHNIFGLDRDRVMRKITASMEKSRQAWEDFEKNKTSPIAPSISVPDSWSSDEKSSKLSADWTKLKQDAAARSEFVKSLETRLYKKSTPERKKSLRYSAYEENPDDYDFQRDEQPFYEDDYVEFEDVKK